LHYSVSDPTASTAATAATDNQCQTDYLTVTDSIPRKKEKEIHFYTPRANKFVA